MGTVLLPRRAPFDSLSAIMGKVAEIHLGEKVQVFIHSHGEIVVGAISQPRPQLGLVTYGAAGFKTKFLSG